MIPVLLHSVPLCITTSLPPPDPPSQQVRETRLATVNEKTVAGIRKPPKDIGLITSSPAQTYREESLSQYKMSEGQELIPLRSLGDVIR